MKTKNIVVVIPWCLVAIGCAGGDYAVEVQRDHPKCIASVIEGSKGGVTFERIDWQGIKFRVGDTTRENTIFVAVSDGRKYYINKSGKVIFSTGQQR